MITLSSLHLLITAFFVGLSGAVAPGPLTAVTVDHTLKKGFKAGPLVAFGHLLIEIIIIILLVAGMNTFFASDSVGGFIGLIGGLVLFWMGYKMFSDLLSGKITLEKSGVQNSGKLDDKIKGTDKNVDGNSYTEKNSSQKFIAKLLDNPITAGTLTTFANPYWFIWWATVGAGYITFSLEQGLTGILFFSLGHFLADLGWLSLIAFVLATGKKFISDKIYQGIVVFLALFIIGMGGYFIWSGYHLLA